MQQNFQRTDQAPPALVTVSGIVTIGQILQMLTVAGSVISATFAAGSYVQALRDEIRSAAHERSSDDTRISDILKDLVNQGQATAKAREAAKTTPPLAPASPPAPALAK